MGNTKIRLIIFFAAKDGEALYSALIYVLILYVKNTITLYFVLAVGSESSRLIFVLQSSFGYS